jgi:hypothetical protein
MWSVGDTLVLLAVFAILCWLYHDTTEAFEDTSFKRDKEYKKQLSLLAAAYEGVKRRPITEMLPSSGMPESHQCLINFYALGCRLPGYIGPAADGYMDPDVGVRQAVNAGCRVFVLDIDYIDECGSENIYPRFNVRDQQGKIMQRLSSDQPVCNGPGASNLATICEKINYYAFADSCQNATDPVIIVLYFLRKPKGSYKSQSVLDYYSKVAKCLAPFSNRLLGNEINGGTFYRQKQENRLLMNRITDYNGRVLIFSNANTIGFREVQTYSPTDDLDYLVNLRLGYTQKPLGITESEAPFGTLESAENYMIIPTDRSDAVLESTKLKWTLCLPQDPLQTVPAATYQSITGTFGVNCVPVMIFDRANCKYMFEKPLFSLYSFLPKPLNLRYIKPPTVVPGAPSKSMDAKGGMLREPVVE